MGVTPALLAAHIDQLSGWQSESASLSELGIARFTTASWKKWGRDEDGNGTSTPLDKADAIMALGRQDCSLSKRMTTLRTKGAVNGDLADLTLAAYAVGVDEVAEVGKSFVGALVRDGGEEEVAAVQRVGPAQSRAAGRRSGRGRAAAAARRRPLRHLAVRLAQTPADGVTKLHTGVDFDAPQRRCRRRGAGWWSSPE
ncbi:hypothetical protein ACFQV4_27340 [Streptomyces thermocarboxydus]